MGTSVISLELEEFYGLEPFMKKNHLERRSFLKKSTALASVSIIPAHILRGENAPSNQFRFAQIGCGGKGWVDRKGSIEAGGKVIALCDVDRERAKKATDLHSDLPFYEDYRELLDKHEKDLDGVVVTTPDHTHACVGLDAIKRGKHVYIQKPLARTYQECEALYLAAKKHNVVTQMGNQGHAGDGLKVYRQMMAEGLFGDVKEVHAWSNRPIWPQGMQTVPPKAEVPSTLNWDLWLGPAAKRDYAKEYLPFSWRGWWDFGCGAMGDMACHNMDPLYTVFQLGLPKKIKAEVSDAVGVAYPTSSTVHYTFDSPISGKEMTLTWHDGKRLPTMPEGAHPELPAGTNGTMILGSKVTVMGGGTAARPRPIAITGESYGSGVKDLERHWREESKKHKAESPYQQWIDSAKLGKENSLASNIDYSVPFTQGILLGCIALRFPGQELHWDNEKKRFSNNKQANKWLKLKPRKGFSLQS